MADGLQCRQTLAAGDHDRLAARKAERAWAGQESRPGRHSNWNRAGEDKTNHKPSIDLP
jgi:hypothetical protein